MQRFLCIPRIEFKVNPSRIGYTASTSLSTIINVACPPKMVSSFQPATATQRCAHSHHTMYGVRRFFLSFSGQCPQSGENVQRESETDRYLPHARARRLAHVLESALHISKLPRRAALSLRPSAAARSPRRGMSQATSLLCPQARQACPPLTLRAGNRQQATRWILFPPLTEWREESRALARLPRQAGR